MSDNLVLQAYKVNGMKGEFMLLGEKDETLPGDAGFLPSTLIINSVTKKSRLKELVLRAIL